MSRRVTGIRAEKVNTRQVLMGNYGRENGTDLAIRRTERAAVLGYWPADLLDGIIDGSYSAPPWTLLQRPTTWSTDDPVRVAEYVEEFLTEYRHWPRLDDLMRHLGKVSNHRAAGEVEGQGALL
jgi:hypothetical protein